jgi:ABC-type antimicrobial peptide transport system permease subunit
LLIAVLVGGGVWLLFAGASSTSSIAKVVRYGAILLSGAIGFVVGMGFYMAVGYIINTGFFLANFKVSFATVGVCLAIAVVVGLVSGLWPALRASRISIAEALRFVG